MTKEKITVGCPVDLIGLLTPYARKKVEHFGIICLDGAHQLIKVKSLFTGGYTSSTVDIRVLLFEAIKCRSVSVIIFHNHPSGNTTPSSQDKNTTEEIEKALAICGMNLLDSIIIGKYDYFSFVLSGLLHADIISKDKK